MDFGVTLKGDLRVDSGIVVDASMGWRENN